MSLDILAPSRHCIGPARSGRTASCSGVLSGPADRRMRSGELRFRLRHTIRCICRSRCRDAADASALLVVMPRVGSSIRQSASAPWHIRSMPIRSFGALLLVGRADCDSDFQTGAARAPAGRSPAALTLALVAAYASYEVVLFAFTPALGGAGAFKLAIVARLGLLNVPLLIGLVAACEAFRLFSRISRRRTAS